METTMEEMSGNMTVIMEASSFWERDGVAEELGHLKAQNQAGKDLEMVLPCPNCLSQQA